jgi:hypothetical protein
MTAPTLEEAAPRRPIELSTREDEDGQTLQPSLDAERLDEAVRFINRKTILSGLDLAREVGKYILDHFFDGDFQSFTNPSRCQVSGVRCQVSGRPPRPTTQGLEFLWKEVGRKAPQGAGYGSRGAVGSNSGWSAAARGGAALRSADGGRASGPPDRFPPPTLKSSTATRSVPWGGRGPWLWPPSFKKVSRDVRRRTLPVLGDGGGLISP